MQDAKGVDVKVSVYKEEDGRLSLLVQASPGKGRPPVLVKHLTEAEIGPETLKLVTAMRRPKGAPPG